LSKIKLKGRLSPEKKSSLRVTVMPPEIVRAPKFAVNVAGPENIAWVVGVVTMPTAEPR
jgi:hypothetical protein